MTMRIAYLPLFLLPFTLLTAQVVVDSVNAPYNAPLDHFERVFTPSAYDTELFLYKKSDTLRQFGRPVDQTTAAPPETLQGFRIQLLATNNFDEANTTRNDLIAGFPELWIYLVFEAPTYKVRVGDFVNRAEAKPLMDQFMAQGYRKSWIVPDRIIRNQPPKPPVPVTFDSTGIRF